MKNFFLLLLLGSTLFSFAQTIDNSDKLIEYLGQEKYDTYLSSQYDYLRLLDIRCDYGFEIYDNEAGKFDAFRKVEVFKISHRDKTIDELTPEAFLALVSSPTFNIHLLRLRWDRVKSTYYRIGNTGKVLHLLSEGQLKRKLQSL